MKTIIALLFGLYVVEPNIWLTYTIQGFIHFKTAKLSKFKGSVKKQSKIYKRTISADLAEDEHLFRTGYL